jgi:hypothetical protein
VIIPLAPELSHQATTGHIFHNLQSGSLISIGQLCDDDCVALFTKYNVKIYKDGRAIIIGARNQTNGLWNIPLAQPVSLPTHNKHVAHSAIRDVHTKQDLATFLHACTFSPLPSTFLRAVQRGHFNTWPGLTSSLITKYLPKSLATSKGHLRMQQKNIQSTKPITITPDLPLAVSLDVSPSREPNNTPTHVVFTSMITSTDLHKSYSDQTGKFPVQSSRGYNYVMVLYDYDSNAILTKPLKTRQSSELTKAWTDLHTRLKLNGYAPALHILDNECSDELKKAFSKNNVTFQRVPPHSHRRNAAERAIQTWKNHFSSGLATCDPKFPLTEWDLLMQQADITLNLLRSSRRQPQLSAYACINGAFDFNQTPLAPPGTRVIVHITPHQRPNMAPHGLDGWYIGPSTEHYRCHKCYIPSTFGVRDALTIDWFPHTVPFPQTTTDDYLRQTASDMLALLNQPNQAVPSLTYSSAITNAYIHIAQILRRATGQPPTALPAREPRVRLPPPATPPTPAQTQEEPVPTPLPPKPSQASPPTKPVARHNIPRLLRTSLPRQRRMPTCFRAPHAQSAQTTSEHPYQHHIAALVTAPVAAGKQASLKTLRKGPDKLVWERGLANEWGRLLPHGIGKNRPPQEQIKEQLYFHVLGVLL